MIFGAASGLVSGGFQGYCSAKNQGLNPWTGAKLPETTVNTPNVPFEVQSEMTPLKLNRYEKIFNGFKSGDKIPPIYVNPGNRGVKIIDIKFIH